MTEPAGHLILTVTRRAEDDYTPMRMVSDAYMAQLKRRDRAISEMLSALHRPEGQYDGLQPQA